MSVKHVRRYHCAVCGETFEKATLLHLHESEHQDYTCSSCNETFSSISDLKVHGCSGLVNPMLEESEGLDPSEEISEDINPAEGISENIDLLDQITEDVNSGSVENVLVDQQEIPVSLESFLIGDILVCVDNGTLKIASGEEFSSDSLLQLNSEVPLSPEDIEEAQTGITTMPNVNIGDDPEATVPTEQPLSSVSLSSPKEVFQCPPNLSPPLLSSAIVHPAPVSPRADTSSQSTPSPLTKNPASLIIPLDPPQVVNRSDKVQVPRLHRAPVVRLKPSGGTCSECGKYFRKTSNLKQHMGIHFADKQLYRCHLCCHTFAWKSSLNKHLVRHFPELVESQKAICHDCGKEYLTSAQVHEHLRRDHLLERPHTCQLCPKAFYKKHDLATHMRVHTKEKPYMCGTCGKTFTHISHVKRHELIHRGVKRYECDTCKARFRQSSGLKAHVRRHHTCLGSNDIMNELCAYVDEISES